MSPEYGVTLLEALVPTLDSSKCTYFKYYDFFGDITNCIRFKVSWKYSIEVEQKKNNDYLSFCVTFLGITVMDRETVPKHLRSTLMDILTVEKEKARKKECFEELNRVELEKQKALEYLSKVSKDKRPSKFDY